MPTSKKIPTSLRARQIEISLHESYAWDVKKEWMEQQSDNAGKSEPQKPLFDLSLSYAYTD